MNIVDVRPTSEGGLTVTVDVDMDTHGGQGGHDIQLSPWWLLSQVGLDSKGRKQPPLQLRLPRRYKPEHWDGESLSRRIRRVDYASFMQEASSPSSPDNVPFWDVVGNLMRLGIVVLTGVPRDEDSVARIANRVANVRETFYGHTFDVRAKPNAENIAYTSGYLGLHQDLLYLDPPPFIQILHCMDNSCAGGESLFSDADRVGRLLAALQDDYPAPVQCLASVPIPYGYRRDGNWYHQRRKLLNLALRDAKLYENVYWSPPFQAEMTIPAPDMAEWIPAARVFEDAVNSPGAVYQTRMEPGDCVLFNNLRVLHGRRAFDAEGGSRWLRGTYISREDFLSTAMHAPETHAAPVDNPHTWWDPDESNRELLESPLCLELKGRLLKCQNPS
ncbi:Taurine catabolism dioxygenase TauD, TfdA family [Geosmithia morbida]|uniref:Taurine catabolism dioxygenase TauD, TfdA family n=1 Tax=Geosmithia morbida TaxID=1094350 RepID=A0A9P5CYR8_9HYPO|nr:Taurine catabolism dioxygenase TauD, TfdA family [Geosmithia morbida]KAF4120738.1 Taurine catabolism dioxygenase TauD, TfdA family [Geosmithia morbida]